MSLKSAPAVRAMLIQAASFGLVLIGLLILGALDGPQLPVGMVSVLQGALASTISRWRRMAPWWLIIQFVFPVAIVFFSAFQVPPWVFLAAFLVLVMMYWSTFRTQVPFFPSHPATWAAVASLLPGTPGMRMIDIGSGFGGLTMHLASVRPDMECTGVELAPLPWLWSALRSRLRRSGARFVRGDYMRVDFAPYDVVFAYLSPAAMPALWEKATREMRQGALLLSYEFVIPCVAPSACLQPTEQGPMLYAWRL